MNQIAGTSISATLSQDTGITRLLYTLALASGLGGVAVWQLRQAWAKESIWPWLILLVAMFYAAGALRQLNLWLPGEAILPRLAGYSSRTFTILGAVFLSGSLALTWLMVRKLLPDYKNLWQGTPLLWLAAMVLVVGGAWMLGAVGRGSPRAATASTLWSDSKRNRRLETAAVILILLLAIFLRAYRFTTVPPGIYVDETNGALDALRILEGNVVSPFGTGWYGTPNGYIYYMAGIIKVLGATWTSLKLISLVPAVLSILAIYFLGRLVFGPVVGLSAMLLMASSRWHMSMSRWGWNETAPPLFQILATFFLIRGLRDRRALDYALSGLFTGLSMYTYLSARLAAATLLLYILLWVLTDRSGMVACLRRSWLGFVLFALAALVAVAPIGVTYYADPFAMNNRVSEISVFRDIHDQHSIQPLVQNIKDILKFFHQTGDHQGKHNLPDEPMTDPITGLLFAIGVAYSILHCRDQRYFLLILWLVIGLAGSFLSSHSESPQSYRALTALPAVMLMAADVLDRVLRTIYKALQGQFFAQSNPKLPAYIAGAIGLLALLGSTAWEANVYFGRQASSPAVAAGFNPTENRVAHEVIAALQSDQEVYLSPGFAEFSPLRYLVYGVIKARTGENTLDNRAYHTLLPATDLPVEDTGKGVLILLDSSYWPLRDYLQFFYPQAKMGLVTMPDGSPLYFKVEIPHEQIAALQGLNEAVTHPDGSTDEHLVPDAKVEDPKASQITWEGALEIEHGGTYQVKGEGGLAVFLDNLPVSGPQYLGRGLYDIKAVWKAGDSPDARLTWKTPDQDWSSIPAKALFRIPGQRQGLLGVYWNNTNWENAPVFHQVTPFLLLAWNDEQPIVPNGPFSARYTGMLKITEPGTYSFKVEADDGARLMIGDQVIGEGMIAGQPNTFEASVDLSAGEHPIRVEYFQQGGGTALRLFWRLGDQPYTPVPPSAFIPAQP
jgi:hypothetical protein